LKDSWNYRGASVYDFDLQVLHHDTPAGDGGLLPSNDDDLGRTFGTPRYGEVAASIIA